MVLSVPRDIIDNVIGALSHDDTATLQLCALVSRFFAYSSQKRLFSIIYIKSWGPQICQRLFALLSASPHIIPHIHELHIIDKGPTPTSSVTDKGWAPEDETLPLLLRLLATSRGLKAFCLVFKPFTDLEWSRLPSKLKTTLIEISLCPSLTSLRLVGMWGDQFPICFFQRLKHLKNLGFGLCSRINQTHDTTLITSLSDPINDLDLGCQARKGQLESLEFGGHLSRSVIESLLDPDSLLDVSRLRAISIHADSWVTFSTFMKGNPSIAEGIESFMWSDPRFAITTISQFHHAPGIPFDLRITPNLRFICFYISAINAGSSELDWIVRSVLDGSIPNTIKEISIVVQSPKLKARLMCGPASVFDICKFFGRSGLDSALSAGTQVYSKLRRVNVFVDAADKNEVGAETFGVLMQQMLPRLTEQDMLYATLCDKDEVQARMSMQLLAY